MNTPMLSDEPSTACFLQRNSLMDDLRSRIIECHPPQVFGVFGDWGCGKTSFLRHVQWKLNPATNPTAPTGNIAQSSSQSPAHTLWFEAWRYSAEDKPVVALIQEIRRTLRWSSDFKAKAWGKLKDLTDVARKAIVATAETTLQALGEKVGIKVNLGDAKQTYSDQLPSDLLREQLSETIDTLLSARGQNRLVIIIDDLDRCHPEAALRLLEGIKIYLNLSNCVFVLGLNAREVQRAIEKHIPGVDDGDHRAARAAEYLEKICGFTLRLPYPSGPQLRHLLQNLWESACLSSLSHHFTQALTDLVCRHRSLPPNARKIKAWVNAVLGLAWQRYPVLAEISDDIQAKQTAWNHLTAEVGRLALAASFHAFHPELYRRLQVNPLAIETLLTWAKGDTSPEPGSTLPSSAPGFSGLRASDPLTIDLTRIQRTHWNLEKSRLTSGTAVDERAITQLRTHYDPSLPNIFHCQRLLVAIDPTPEEIDPWFPSAWDFHQAPQLPPIS